MATTPPRRTRRRCAAAGVVEPLFAEAKEWHGLRRSRPEDNENVNNEALLVAVGQVLKRFLTVQALGMQRHFQEVETGRYPTASELCA